MIVRDGEFVRDGMQRERLNEQDVLAMLRLHDVRDMREVQVAILETDGEMSVLRYEWAEPPQKADVLSEHERDRKEVLNGVDEAPASKRTDSPAALGEA